MNCLQAAIGFMLASLVPPAHAEQPNNGDIYDIDEGERFRSWVLRHSDPGGNRPVWSQPYSVFEDTSGTYVIATIEAVSSGKVGIRRVDRILFSMKVKPMPGEIVLDGYDCGFLDQSPMLTFFNPKTKIATGYFAVSKDSIWKRRWLIDDMSECQPSAD